MVVLSEPTGSILKTSVLRLGDLHTEKSFLDSIGHLMAGSGLQELLEVVYANRAVGHILRAVCGHFLVDEALNTMLVINVYNLLLPIQ